ncbi:nitroreductase family protein [Marinobacterium sp. D7]|uniref:nitroreductase family protein n=1 Tax=Marinobacterium ramblicola TaxID=2849041 RepID=UPI001C2DBB5C|nr:nitroreductase family protein [Marinobacterium ramblicola]MBV1789049.1 nitroreductase family protein [Marinobacterium ramblicola]
MNLHQVITERRSIKQFDPEYRIGEQAFQQIMEHAILAPTSFNIQHWRFVRVQDPELRHAIKEAAWGQAQVTDASELLIVAADIKAWEKQPERYWRNVDDEKRDVLVPMLKSFYQDRDWLQRDEAIRSGAFAAQNIMLSAQALGYACCPMIGFDPDRVAQLIGLPEDHLIVVMLAMGKAVVEPWPRGGQLPLDEVLVANRF